MAGYVRKMNGHVYDGAHTAAEQLPNGVFAEIAAGGVRKLNATGETLMRVAEKTDLWGVEALVLDVVATGKSEEFFVESEWDYNDSEAFDEAKYTLPAGKMVRMRRLLTGDQVIMTVEKALYGALTLGGLVTCAPGGTVAAYTPPAPENPEG